jgi:hypothetical protein
MKSSNCVSILMIAILLLAPLAALGAQETQPGGLPADERPSKAFRTGGWILVGTGAVLGILGGLLLVEGFTSDNQDTADHSKMFGISALVAGGLSAGVGIFLIKVPLR